MSKIAILVFFLTVIHILYYDGCTAIIIPEQQQSKPSYTSGIKTANWKQSLLTHQNYSKVNVHNKPDAEAQYFVTQTQKTQKIYPVYNAHSYGPNSKTHLEILETNLHSEIDTNELSAPNRTIFKRKIEYKSLEIYDKCPSGVTGQFVYASSCNQYLNCWKGRGVVQNCAPGTLFNPKTLECDFPDKVECITGPSHGTFANLRVPKSVQQANCPEGFSGLIPNYTDCSKFISCNNGQPFPMDCPPGTLFDINQNICDHPQKGTCFNGHPGSDHIIRLNQQQQQQNQGQYYQTIQGHSGHCPNVGSSCTQGIPTQSQYDSSYSGTQDHSYQPGNNRNSIGSFQQSGTSLFPFNRQNQGSGQGTTFIITNGQRGCNPQYLNCSQQTEQSQGTFQRQSPIYGQSGQNLGHDQISSHTPSLSGWNHHRIQGQNILNTQSTPNYGSFNTNIGYNIVTDRNCNPSTQNCVQNTRQTQGYDLGYGQSSVFTYGADPNCDLSDKNCKQTVRQSQVPTTHRTVSYFHRTVENCNPFTQNCQQGQRTITDQNSIHTNLQNCDPSIQNCGQNQISSNFESHGSPSDQTTNHYPIQNCDPSKQNCVLPSRISPNDQIIIHSSSQDSLRGITLTRNYNTGQICNPFLSNCGGNTGHGSAQNNFGDTATQEQSTIRTGSLGQNCNTPSHNCGQNNPLQYNSNVQTNQQFLCDPRTLLCRQNTGQSGITHHSSSQTSQNIRPLVKGAVQFNCDLSAPNCGHNSGHQEIRITDQATDPNQGQLRPNIHSGIRNYNAICNINDNNCLRGHSIVTRRTTPKCPDGFQGLTKHPSDCKKFLNCANGQTFVQDCAPGTLFNPSVGNCDFPYNVDCEISKRPNIETDTSYGVDWSTEYKGNVQEVGPNENIRLVTVKPDNSDRVNTYEQNTITDTNIGKIGFVNRPSHPSSTIEPNNQYLDQSPSKLPDYVDVFDPKEQTNLGYPSTTQRSAWPPPFPESVPTVDYVFDYEDGESVTLDPDDIYYAREKKGTDCDDGDFHCSTEFCISQTMVCDGHRDCGNGNDEQLCEEYISRFSVFKNSQLVVLENERWVNASYATCAMLCIQNTKFTCRSFNYRKIDRTCFLSDRNIGLTGTLRKYFPTDYYELKAGSIDCSDQSKYFQCSNEKCLNKERVCDGNDDCGDRQDEKNCKAEDFGYSIKISGSNETNEGNIVVTAFGKTGYICDDQFGIKDANVVCRELGFELGAAEVKGQSYFSKVFNESNTLYMMDEVECIGNETTLLDCGFAGWGVHDCRPQEIAGVVCKTPQEKCGQGFWRCETGNECVPYHFVCDGVNDCSDDSDEKTDHCDAPTEIRLVNGTRSNEGRLEIKHHGIWGTICDDDFNEDAAKVVCKYFGFRGMSIVKKEAYFGQGDGPIWLDQVSCYGNETQLEKCTHWNWGEHNCEHNEDVGVICSDEIMEVEVQRNSKLPIRYESGLPKKCGFRKDNQFLENDLIHARVVSGSVARKGDYPWQAALKIKVKETSVHWCGAVIISSKWVLTAAHCLQGYTKGAYVIIAGEYNTDEDEETEQRKYIEEFFIHERFRKGHKMNNDIALIKVKGGGFVLNDDVQPICLPDTDVTYYQDLNCTISGFGSVKSGTSAYSHNMMAAWIPIHSNDICKMPHIYGNALAEGMFCAGFLDGGIDACEGDSGGPLACLEQGYFTLYGLTSWGQHCGYANKPGVYVKVAYYRPWIEDIIQRHSQL